MQRNHYRVWFTRFPNTYHVQFAPNKRLAVVGAKASARNLMFRGELTVGRIQRCFRDGRELNLSIKGV